MDLPVALRLLRLEGVLVEMAKALDAAGVPFILLKGPVTNAWLYGGYDRRSYRDVDLLVPPLLVGEAGRVLTVRGFVDQQSAGLGIHHLDHETSWVRAGVSIDLHTRLAGIPLARAQDAWDGLAATTVPFSVQKETVRSLAPAARAMHLALHAAQSKNDTKAMDDLILGLQDLPPELWVEASALAARLGATGSFALGLRSVPEGGALADRLAAGAAPDVLAVLRARGALIEAISLAALAGLPPRERARRLRGWLTTTSTGEVSGRTRISAAGKVLVGGMQVSRAVVEVRLGRRRASRTPR